MTNNPYEFAKSASIEDIGSRIECAETDAVYWKEKYYGRWAVADIKEEIAHFEGVLLSLKTKKQNSELKF
jgi:hypothetical protein